MVDIVISVAAKVAECLVDPIARQLGYLFNYRRNYVDLTEQIEMLDDAKVRLQRSVEEASRQGLDIFPDVRKWLEGAERIIQKKEDLIEDEKKASKSCFHLKSRYQLSKQAKKQTAEIVLKIQQAGNLDGIVSCRPPPPPLISSASFKDYEAFQSRESTFNQIMEALRNKDTSMIGVWGMGGVCKTTLVKQVAKQAEEHKLFHKVVMALNISKTPNIAEIQGKIASMLGLTLEDNNEREVRLRQSLKNQETILVILDDIWGKLGLEKIGIPYGDDHKGCKLLLTSRERQVLDTDMRTQKEFQVRHLNEEEAWSLFKRTAGDSVEQLELRSIAVNVVKKCEGLPIAIVTIANALKNKSVPVWENALEELRMAAPTNIRGVTEGVYSCLELSYNHLVGDEVKSLFLLCALLGDGDISMDRLLQFAMCLNLFERTYSWEKAINKLITLVENLKVSSLLLDHEGDGDDSSSLLFDHAFVRMHDVVRDVARSIASKDSHRFVVREAVELREWQRTDECRNCTRISLICRNMDELPQGLVCPQLEFFLLNSSNDDPYLKIPDAFFQDTKQLRILDLYKIQDITVIGELKKLQVLSLAESDIEQLPNEVAQLSDLRMLDLQNCRWLRVIPRNVISSLSRLEYLSMKECSRIEWEAEGFNRGERINACLSDLKHLSGLRTLEVQVSDPSLFPEDDVPFENLNLTRYSIVINPGWIPDDVYKASRRLWLEGVTSLYMVKCFSKLLKRSQVLDLQELNDTKHVVYELDKEGFVELKYLTLEDCPTVQYILHSSTSVEWVPPPNTFCMLEKLSLTRLDNLEAVCHGPIPMGSFGNLRFLELLFCRRLKNVFSLPAQHGRESAFPQLQHLELRNLRELISFYSTRSSGTQESMTFFSQQVALPGLESLQLERLDNIRALKLEVIGCNKLLNLFPIFVASALVQLEDLLIWQSEVEAIVANENEGEAAPLLLFPNLTSLRLWDLHQLKRFCSERFSSSWPLLKRLEVHNCDKVKILFQQISLECELDNKIQQPLFWVEKEAFPNLEVLGLSLKGGNVEIWRGQFSRVSFSKLRVLMIKEYHGISVVIPSNMVQILHNLEELNVTMCDSVNEVIQVERLPSEEFHVETLPRLIEICLKDLPMLMHLSGLGPYFQSLQALEIISCGSLINLVTPLMAKRLVQLKKLIIQKCHMMKEIVGNDGHELIDNEIEFTRLKSLTLYHLPNLKSFCSSTRYVFKFPSLETMEVRECRGMEFFCKGVLDAPRLKSLRNEFFKECWQDDLNTTIRKKFMEQV
ncbi:hypothetical protein PVL29_013684 [Vitis rotundifolia]|uniref:AAA+ ATPase domain-containing protein n=1 Tax=Vitis rotundifolia TaxID=103349 RepID=A0AA38ZMX9_VITRO|nr:hypothetical protein PVL29_013684 [Vitis rotundifolia]